MKKTLLLLGALFAATVANAEVAEKLYLVGDPVGGWNPGNGVEMTKTSEGVFEIDHAINGSQWFAFVTELNDANDWGAFNSHRYGAVDNGMTPTMDTPAAMQYGQDASFHLNNGEYHFLVNTNDMTLTVTGQAVEKIYDGDMYFRGTLNGWGTGDEYKMTNEGDGVYTYTIPSLEAGSEFKFADPNWNQCSVTTDKKDMVIGESYPIQLATGENMAFASNVENVKATLNLKEMTLSFKAVETAVAELAADAAAEYYTLQGVRVANPDKGIYLVKKGDKVSKVVIR